MTNDGQLGGGGHAHEHGEALDAAYASTNETRRANTLSTIALVVAALTSIPAWLSYTNSSVDLRQSRETALLQERIATCAQVDSVSYAVTLEASNQRVIFGDRRSTRLERLEATRAILDANVAFINAAHLSFYGPTELMGAETAVREGVGNVLEVFAAAVREDNALDEAALDQALGLLALNRDKLRRACAAAVGPYRDGPVSPS